MCSDRTALETASLRSTDCHGCFSSRHPWTCLGTVALALVGVTIGAANRIPFS
ncbi:MAG: hypothetical protein HWQ42_00620 [Nostoc sp. JL23]|nr:hypothetical protein [Nostoc sp. JL23]